MNPSTFIILVNYNNHDDTLKCLESIELAGFGAMVVVVDNNSTLPGVDEIKARYPKTILIKNDENIGFGRANNIGIDWALKNTNCEYVFILNNDTTINRNTISILEEALSINENIAIAAPKIVMMDDPNLLWYGGGEINWKKCSATIPGYMGTSHCEEANSSRFVTFASGCAILIKRSILEKFGGFDKRFFMYVEDIELCIRIIKNKYHIAYKHEAVVSHKGQGSQRNSEKFISIEHPKNPNLSFFVYHLTKNRLLTISQHASITEAIKFWTFYPFFLFAKSVQYSINGRIDAIKAISKGLFDAFKVFIKSP